MTRVSRARLVVCSGWALLCACSNGDAQERRSVDLSSVPGDAVHCVWESGPWRGADWISYPGRVTLDVAHGWRCDGVTTPRDVSVYLAFERTGQLSTLGAGDPAVVDTVDASHVVVRNNTNQDFFIRIVLR